MSLIRCVGSGPEMKLRRLVHGMGFRYRLHIKGFTGKPDLVFPSRRAVIFMHGCFRYRHEDCKLARLPKSKLDFWEDKLEANRQRGLLKQRQLRDPGWRVLVVWECEMVDIDHVSIIVDEFLRGQVVEKMKSVELFAGAGGLAMGISLAGFESLAVVEWDKRACETIRENQKRGYPLVRDLPLWEGDVRHFDWSSVTEEVDLLAGGPPCQPFSMGGKHRAHGDERDMFPPMIEIIRRLAPRVFIIENVKGLTRSSFANYYQYILLRLEFPEVTRKSGETWMDHLSVLQKEKTSGALHHGGLTYNVVPTLINAADYGVPQKRERVFIVGFRSDLGIDWSFPRPTHSFDALLYSQWISGEYWDRHGAPRPSREDMPKRLKNRIMALSDTIPSFGQKPWRTVRDALMDIPDPRDASSREFYNHDFQDGAKTYKGHTGSPLDLPAKTLKAGDHGVPGGENTMALKDGKVRYFTAREAARVQTFSDGYVFPVSWTETMRQLGNAVPVSLARRVAASVAERLAEIEIHRASSSWIRNAA